MRIAGRGSCMAMPNFLLIGTMKAGTTSLYYYLKQHPQVYMSPVKAPDFFTLEGRELDFNGPEGRAHINRWISENKATSIEEYRALFRGVSTETAIGEATPVYLYSPEALSRIKHHIPEAKLIAVLRNPADRAYSAFLHCVRDGREPLDFTQALQAEEERIRNHWEYIWHYKNMGFYYPQLERCYEMFEKEQIRIYLYGDLKEDPVGVAQDIFRYLEVDDAFAPNISREYNVAGVPKRRALHRLVNMSSPVKTLAKAILPQELGREMKRRVQHMSLTKAPPLRPEVRRGLIETYRQDILQLQDLIRRDLSEWLR